eukprot:COSAG01_NODE_623_length_14742_cov_22.391177_7_plen_398_part_00
MHVPPQPYYSCVQCAAAASPATKLRGMPLSSTLLRVLPFAGCALAHVQLLSPTTRNTVDRNLPQWKGGKFGNNTCDRTCWQYTCWGGNCHNGTHICDVGQNFLWFTQGTSIGCAKPDGHLGNNRTEGGNNRDRCGSGMKPTNNDARFRTFHRDVPAMSAQDIYQHNPWRAPGNAPVFSPCGAAGGGPNRVSTGAPFVDNALVRQGDLGTTLPKNPTGITWHAGQRAEVKLSVRANHGGGWSFRICPADKPLTEACMQQRPLDFAERTWLEFRNGSRHEINSVYLTEGTFPRGSMWALNPLPFPKKGSFSPPCEGKDNRTDPIWTWGNMSRNGPAPAWEASSPLCEGTFPFGVNIVHHLEIPYVPSGEYVLGLRYDSENTAQVWQQCSDIVIKNDHIM